MPNILVVDDSKIICKKISDALSLDGFTVTVVEDGEAAYLKFLEGEFDLVITDIVMPVCDGIKLTQNIRRKSDSLPIIILTSAGDQSYVDRAKAAGANGYILKPLNTEILLERVYSLLGVPS